MHQRTKVVPGNLVIQPYLRPESHEFVEIVAEIKVQLYKLHELRDEFLQLHSIFQASVVIARETLDNANAFWVQMQNKTKIG